MIYCNAVSLATAFFEHKNNVVEKVIMKFTDSRFKVGGISSMLRHDAMLSESESLR